MRISLKIAFFLAAVIVIALIWIYTPMEKPTAEVWSQGFKLRLSGFSLIGLFLFYLFFDRVVFVKKSKKRNK